MTAQQTKTIQHINDGLAAERDQAAQASREVAELDAGAVLVAIEVKLNEGNIDAARALAAEWRASKKAN